ncbi:MAG: YggS family pyridoxal phosphate-dependent enzyme [Acholeplasmataceae bacterium]
MSLLNLSQTVICASKYFDTDEIIKIHRLGINHFGENRVQDLLKKQNTLSDEPLIWHFIGHLQTNKVKSMINQIDYIHTLDRLSLAEAIQKYASEPKKCFIQLNLTQEDQKSGLFEDNLAEFLKEIKKYDKINIIGLMTIGKLDDHVQTEKAFKKLAELSNRYGLPYRSMGMSDDYQLAILYGATHLRIGSKFKQLI